MSDDDYFLDSVPDGVSTAIHALFPGLPCSNQDAYELLVAGFGDGFGPADLEQATPDNFARFASKMTAWFELEQEATADQAAQIVSRALRQWR